MQKLTGSFAIKVVTSSPVPVVVVVTQPGATVAQPEAQQESKTGAA
jgi:hypothetical protein